MGPQAVADRIQILDYWYKRLGTKEYSQKLDEMFKESVELLSQFPFLDRQVKNREVRVFVKDHYQIFYLNNEDTVRILHVWDSRRNPEELNL
ncbi:type II toxin-antitoxin system RelE/ParE family toxin [Aliifodinibius sp. S!AR15-10]|uniref:type II toxin-antitoxin system RelE/ParE family toxin n=1 Tax=Aliifodinibius sp. S!AR15-10 TaxID=2950437 RepID=UPI0028556553|nr:type II toxin-antitoxin system RelE/ParE family toxin [Aliifodinibius sp. S!AR15-10]MDR8391173.1 type II toxin-antitoxin system RelE/ParE family toxin [Aliifodinibius sp. S!AR15-10]